MVVICMLKRTILMVTNPPSKMDAPFITGWCNSIIFWLGKTGKFPLHTEDMSHGIHKYRNIELIRLENLRLYLCLLPWRNLLSLFSHSSSLTAKSSLRKTRVLWPLLSLHFQREIISNWRTLYKAMRFIWTLLRFSQSRFVILKPSKYITSCICDECSCLY